MKITIDLTKEDLYKGMKFVTYKTKTGKKQLRNVFLWCFAIFFVMDLFGWVTEPVSVLEAIITVILDLLFLLIFTHLFIWVRMKFFPTRVKGVLGEHTVELDHSGLRESTDYNDSLERWNAIDELLQNDEAIYFIYSSSVLAVPHRFFSSREEANEFYQLACQYWKDYTYQKD